MLRFLTEHEHAVVGAAADLLIPPSGPHPGGAALGVADYVDRLLGAFTFDPPLIFAGGPFSGRAGGAASFADFLPLSRHEALAWRTRIEGSRGLAEREFNGPVRGWQQIYREGIAALDADFTEVDTAEQDRRLRGQRELRHLLYEHACEGAYGPPEYGGNRDLAGWRAIESGATPNPADTPTTKSAVVPERSTPDCDAVIIGTGPAGATAADVLTGAGWSVIMLEKGSNHLLSLDAPFGPLGHVSNDEIKFLRRHFLGPDPFLEPRTYRRDDEDGERLFSGEVNNLPSTVGGGGFHADAKLPRFRAVDFKARSELGPIAGSDIVDWPVDYDELEPYYAHAERLVGVAGLAGANPFAEWRSDEYPMPPGADMFGSILTTEAAMRLGYHPYAAPTGVNSIPYDGRPACNNCGFCGFFGCPIDAKGDPVAPLRNALRTGRCQIRPQSYVERVVLDASGRAARGVRYQDADGNAHEVTARVVIVAGGAWETPRLLLRSEIANSSGLVGRYLMYHFQTYVVGTFPFRLHGHRGRSVTHLHDDHMIIDAESRAFAKDHALPYFRAGIVEHGGGGHPVLEAVYTAPGPAHTQAMLDSPMRDRLWAFTIQGEDLPQVANRIDLDPNVRDVYGFPAGRATYDVHAHEVVASRYYTPKLAEIMREAGAETTFSITSPRLDGDRAGRQSASISRHIMGTCRMGDDPRTSVVDRWQRFHDVENMLCTDSSVFPTSTGYGPTLTIVALAIRACRELAGLPQLRSERPQPA